jgi:hypothetical protein
MWRNRDGEWVPDSGESVSFDFTGRNTDILSKRRPDMRSCTPGKKPEKDDRDREVARSAKREKGGRTIALPPVDSPPMSARQAGHRIPVHDARVFGPRVFGPRDHQGPASIALRPSSTVKIAPHFGHFTLASLLTIPLCIPAQPAKLTINTSAMIMFATLFISRSSFRL